MSKRNGGEPATETDTAAAAPEAARLAIRVGPALAHAVTTVTRTDVSLVTAIGEMADDQRVLVPFLECAVYGSRDEDEPLWVGRLAMDNVAFLLEQVAVGLVEALEPLASMSRGDLRPQSVRIDYAADRAASAGESLRDAAVSLRAIAGQRL